MWKRPVFGSLVLVGVMGLAIGFYTLSGFAQGGETITITTYYPAPYGVYNELRANKMVIGESDSGAIPSPDTEGVMIFKGISEPTGSNDQQDGALYYDDSEHKFKYYDGSASKWKEMGGFDVSFSQPVRSLNSSYQNGDAVRIVTVSVGFGAGGGYTYCEISVDGTTWQTAVWSSALNNAWTTSTFIIPKEWYYRVRTNISAVATLRSWSEWDLR